MAYTAGFSVNVGDPTKASDVTTLAANDDYLKAAVDAIMADSATPSSTLKATVVLADGVTATTQSAGNNTTRVATTAFVKTAVDASSTDPAGSNTEIQYNNSGAFGASANLTFDGTTLTVGGVAALTSSQLTFADDGLVLWGSSNTANMRGKDGADGYLRFDTQATARAYIDADGKVGIGTTSPADLLHLSSSGALNLAIQSTHANIANTFKINVGDPTGTSGTSGSGIALSSNEVSRGFFFRQDGNVGIGTTAPEDKLHVVESNNTNVLYVEPTHASFSANGFRVQVSRSASSDYNFAYLESGDGADGEFKLRGDGNGYSDGGWHTGNGDYAEYFESTDGTAIEVGTSVVMDGDKVRAYNASSDSADNIIGVTRPKADGKIAAIIGNTAWNHWADKYLTDDWGVYLREDVTVWEWDDVLATESDVVEAADATYYEEGDDIPEDKKVGDVKTAEVVGVAVGDVKIKAGSCYERDELAKDSEWTPPTGATSSTQSVRKRNPDYDEDRTYTPREERDEWNLIGLLGQVQIKANEPTRPTWIKMKQISDSVDLWLVR